MLFFSVGINQIQMLVWVNRSQSYLVCAPEIKPAQKVRKGQALLLNGHFERHSTVPTNPSFNFRVGNRRVLDRYRDSN